MSGKERLSRGTAASLGTASRRGAIEIDRVSIIFGRGAKEFIAVDRVSASIAAGEFVCLLGPSGCGKSTVMNAVAGFEHPSEGRITLDGATVTGPGADRGMVFQQPTLFPWKTIRANVAHGPRMLGKSKAEAMEIADGLLEMVGLAAFADNHPHTLSGGMQQRTAIARALANTPSVLLMDEPFGALDAQTRSMMQESLLQIWADVKPTVIFVTHDIDEAIFLADRILVMSASPGRFISEIPVDLPRPRDAEMTLEPAFMEIKRRCAGLIRTETLKAFEQQSAALRARK
ncbi:ABC transporter ATP-binding protein [Lutibaculum baratangense]|uniref:ABC transporter n=1 Tax=Lutibaculum baratangense AMV1 TaxID=631454 RepID=V4RHT1_9HYPH|nr:ABC transporter ATP-binding protein [Lutibaculum baratangense]ESR24874.1 ABC transporter [Lutibaculum baratangense AMV1]